MNPGPLLERISSPTESEFELRATRGRGRIACTGSAPRVAALGRRARSAAFPRALGGSGVSCCRRCCRRPVFRQRRTPPGSVSRNPQTSASSRAVGSVSAAVLRRSRGARGVSCDCCSMDVRRDLRENLIRRSQVSLRSGAVEVSPKAMSSGTLGMTWHLGLLICLPKILLVLGDSRRTEDGEGVPAERIPRALLL
ncbi:uncharacterized protein LOC123851775 [Mirounga angustirostris]|uniref:uncharacterized protein LOC123851775 n=1 Tax=Mirounga angustirostris TaxID=9716 RepID=UPI00313BA652